MEFHLEPHRRWRSTFILSKFPGTNRSPSDVSKLCVGCFVIFLSKKQKSCSNSPQWMGWTMVNSENLPTGADFVHQQIYCKCFCLRNKTMSWWKRVLGGLGHGVGGRGGLFLVKMHGLLMFSWGLLAAIWPHHHAKHRRAGDDRVTQSIEVASATQMLCQVGKGQLGVTNGAPPLWLAVSHKWPQHYLASLDWSSDGLTSWHRRWPHIPAKAWQAQALHERAVFFPKFRSPTASKTNNLLIKNL